MAKTKILITGNAGFIGSHLADYFVNEGYDVYGIDNLSTGSIDNINLKVKFNELDLCDFEAVKACLEDVKPRYVFHLGALARIQPSIEDPIKWNDNNSGATLNLLEACRQVGSVDKVVYSSSSSIYGDNDIPFKEDQEPRAKHPYGLSKLQGEEWCKLYHDLYNLDTTVLRYFNVYGPRQVLEGDYATVVGIFMKQKADRKKLTIVGDGTQKRDMTYVDDVVSANVMAAFHEGFGIYNIGTGSNYQIKEIAQMIQPDVSQHEYGMVRRAEAKVTLASNDKARKGLDWEPTFTLEDGIADMQAQNKQDIFAD